MSLNQCTLIVPLVCNNTVLNIDTFALQPYDKNIITKQDILNYKTLFELLYNNRWHTSVNHTRGNDAIFIQQSRERDVRNWHPVVSFKT